MAIPHGFIQELLNRVDVVEVVGRYVQLKKTGANLSGLCPFHSEKTPSFTVSPSKQFYHCFGCGKSGDAVNFLMEHNGLGFVEAVQDLAAQHGMQVPDDRTSPQDRARAEAQRQKQTTLSDVLEKAAASYKKQLKTNAQAIDYLKQRGLTGAIAQRFGIGYAPAGWRHLSTVFPDYTSPLLEESGLVIHHRNEAAASSHSEHANPAEHPEQRQEQRPEQRSSESRYDRFRHRIMFPIRNIKGQYIGFGGRVLGDEKPKYLNSPETPVFSKGRELYGLFEARQDLRQHGFALVTEGYMDVVALAQLGFGNAVATLGTACTSDHVRKLFRYTDSIVFSFDGDTAGRNAARKALQAALPFASDTRSVKFLFLPEQHDPDSFIRAHGAEGFAQAVAQATPLSQFLRDAASAGCELSSTEGRARLSSQAGPLWQLLPEGAFKRQLLSELAHMIGLNSAELETLWGNTAPQQRSAATATNAPAPASPSPQPTYAATHASASHPDSPPPYDPISYNQHAPHQPPEQPPAIYAHSAPASRQRSRTPFTPWSSSPASPRRASKAGRSAIHTQADHALRYLLGSIQTWDALSTAQHHVLVSQPWPHGAFFAWLETQYIEHGNQPWSALRVALQDPSTADFAALAAQLMNSDHRLAEPDANEFMQNVRALQLQQLKQQQAMAYAQHDLATAQRLTAEIAQITQTILPRKP